MTWVTEARPCRPRPPTRIHPGPGICSARRMSTEAQLDHGHVWHPFTQQRDWVAEEPLMIERGEGNELIDSEGKPLPRRRLLALVQRPRPSPPGDRPGRAGAARQGRALDDARPLPPGRRGAGGAAGRDLRAAGPQPRLLLGLGLDGRRGRAEDGLPVLAAPRRPACAAGRSFICLEEGYHGDTIGSVSVGGMDLFHSTFGPLLFESHRAAPGDVDAHGRADRPPRGGAGRGGRRAAGPGGGRDGRAPAGLPARGPRALRPPRGPADLR